jgi:Radical SAM superfamily/Iron-sulfur cluster-binding domain
MYVGAEVFQPQGGREAAKAVFARSVGRVEVETHSFCNRRCNYCPNVVGDRLGDNKQMKPAHWQMIVRDLAEIGFSQNFVFTSYNEPLADRDVLERISEVRSALPRARLMVYTNGDYLNSDYLEDLAVAGLDYLHISIHTRYNGKYADVDALNLIARLVRRLRTKIRYTTLRTGSLIAARIPHEKIEIDVRAINYFEHGTDRAGLIEVVRKPPVRTAPCHFPFAHFHVGFSGNVVPCCHVRSDSNAHADYRYGNLDDFGSIYEAWAGRMGAAWRAELITPLTKRAPCDTCSVGFLNGDASSLEQVRGIWTRHVQNGVLPKPAEES